jgi:hypothetical protein
MSKAPVSRVALIFAWSRGVAFLAAVLWVIDLLTRPPCPSGFVRFIDGELALPVVSALVGAVAWAMVVSSRRRTMQGQQMKRKRKVGAVVILVFSALLLLWAGVSIGEHRTMFDSGCWTF